MPKIPEETIKFILDLHEKEPNLNTREIARRTPPYKGNLKTGKMKKVSWVTVYYVIKKKKLAMGEPAKKDAPEGKEGGEGGNQGGGGGAQPEQKPPALLDSIVQAFAGE